MPKRKNSTRRKSSGSDIEDQVQKQQRHDNGKFNLSVSDVISEANCVLYDAEDSSVRSSETDNCEVSQKNSPTNMATPEANSGSLKEISEQMKQVLSTVTEIKSSQEQMRKSFDSKLDKMRNEFLTTIDGKLKLLRNEISMDIGRESSRIDQLKSSLESIQTRLEAVEHPDYSNLQRDESGSQQPGQFRENRHDLDNPELCITSNGLPHDDDEDLMIKATELIRALGDLGTTGINITGATRLKPRFDDKPGLVKISFQTIDEKVRVLRNKHKLKDVTEYKGVFLKSSKSHAERLIELNARMLLRQIPQGNNFWVDSNGRIRPRQNRDNDNNNQ